MRTLCMVVCLVAVGLFATSSASGLEIRVAPNTLVLSSPGGQLTVHTDVPIGLVKDVSLEVNGKPVTLKSLFPDCLGNLVAQCSKAAVAAVIDDDFDKKTKATVTLTVNGVSDSETITVRK